MSTTAPTVDLRRKADSLTGWRTFRQVCLKLHLYGGMGALLFAAIFGVTGGILAFEKEIERWLTYDLTHVAPAPGHLPVSAVLEGVNKAYPGSKVVSLRLPVDETATAEVLLARPHDGRLDLFVDWHTGKLLGTCGMGCTVMEKIRSLHTNLLLGRPGIALMGYATALLLFLGCSGLYLWWKRKLLTLNPRRRFWRLNFDLHNVLGLYMTPFLLVFTLTGLAMSFQWPRKLLTRLDGSKAVTVLQHPPLSTPIRGVARRSFDDQISSAEAAVPDRRVGALNVARTAKDSDMIFMIPPSGNRPGVQATIAYVDQYSGKVLRVWTTGEFGLGSRLLRYNVPLHTGSIGGLPTEVLMSLASLGLSVLSITGILIWWKREVQ